VEVDVSGKDRRSQARIEALGWYLTLDTTMISNAALEAFSVWRRDPTNRAAYEAVEDEAGGAKPTIQ
jgi:ferric-dicitrate binding protein FerR (iron transport regulator)